MANYRVYVDLITENGVEGWSCLEDAPTHRPRLTLIVNGSPRTSAISENFRPDVFAAGIGDGYYGYKLNPLQPLDLNADQLHIAVDDTVFFAISFVTGKLEVTQIETNDIVERGELSPGQIESETFLFSDSAGLVIDDTKNIEALFIEAVPYKWISASDEKVSISDLISEIVQSEVFLSDVLPFLYKPFPSRPEANGAHAHLAQWVSGRLPLTAARAGRLGRCRTRTQILAQILSDPVLRAAIPALRKAYFYEEPPATETDILQANRLFSRQVQAVIGKEALGSPITILLADIVASGAALSLTSHATDSKAKAYLDTPLSGNLRDWALTRLPLTPSIRTRLSRNVTARRAAILILSDPLMRLMIPEIADLRLPLDQTGNQEQDVLMAYAQFLGRKPQWPLVD